jgi:hypothetical protein
MPDKLREFIYLNDVSVNSHLSSLGEGKPQEIVQEEGRESETGGGIDVKIKGDHRRKKMNSTATTMNATAPYRFERLRSKLNEEDIPIHDNPDPRSVSRGDVVRVNGSCRPMSLYRIEIAVQAMIDMVDENKYEKLIDFDVSDVHDADSDELNLDLESDQSSESVSLMFKLADLLKDLAGELIGDKVPIRQKYNGESLAASFDRNHFRISGREAFFEQKDYVLFGRVDERLGRSEEWDPINANNVMRKYFESDTDVKSQRGDWADMADQIGISMNDQDMIMSGRSLIVHPIALYW